MKKFRHVLNSGQFAANDLQYIFNLSDKIRACNDSKKDLMFLRSLLPHRRAMLFFSQPSTRTFLSFQSACTILGMQTSDIRDPSTSSEKKGETIEDSMRTFSSYVDLIIMRSPIAGLCERIATMLDKTKSAVPIINAGSGPDEHPTQALLDLYTLQRSFKDINGIDGKTICMVGDLKRGRTVRSLSLLLTHYQNVHIIFCSPVEFAIAEDLRTRLKTSNLKITETTDFATAIQAADAIYMTRIQDEYDSLDPSLKSVDTSKYNLTPAHLPTLKETCRILHPMPRRQELDPAIDKDRRAAYWRQQRNGMWVRAALIAILMGVDAEIFEYSTSKSPALASL